MKRGGAAGLAVDVSAEVLIEHRQRAVDESCFDDAHHPAMHERRHRAAVQVVTNKAFGGEQEKGDGVTPGTGRCMAAYSELAAFSVR